MSIAVVPNTSHTYRSANCPLPNGLLLLPLPRVGTPLAPGDDGLPPGHDGCPAGPWDPLGYLAAARGWLSFRPCLGVCL